MTENAIDITRPEAQLTRTGLELRQLSEAWRFRHRGPEFLEALLTFLATKSKGTRRVYAFGILEFFSWYQLKQGKIPLPSEVRRSEAALFTEYLQTRTETLDEFRLERDPTRSMDLAIYRFVKKNAGETIGAIRRELLSIGRWTVAVTFQLRGIPQTLRVLDVEQNDLRGDAAETYEAEHGRPAPNGLDLFLSCLCQHLLLQRTPTLLEIRRGEVNIGEDHPDQAQLGYRVDPEIFKYFVKSNVSKPSDRISTVVGRLSALSSFWAYLADTGENQGDADPLLKYNVWKNPGHQLRKRIREHHRAHRALATPDAEIFISLLTETYRQSHPDQPEAVARAALNGADVSSLATADASTLDLRDRALLTLMYWTGLRATELSGLRRFEITEDERGALIDVLGKGALRRVISVPEPAVKAIRAMQKRLDILDKNYASKPDALIHRLVLPEAPLIPPLKRWGRAELSEDATNVPSLTTGALQKILQRLGEAAGIQRDSADWPKLHPHGLRHLAATQAREAGVDLPTIQATLGHLSIASTGIYVEVRDARERSLMPKAKKPVAAVAAPPVIIEAPSPAPVEESEATPEFERVTETISERIALTDEAKALAKESDAVAYLLDIYKSNWGEAGDKARGVKSERTHLLAQVKGGGGILSHAYVGKASGLCWWAGATGAMTDTSYSYVPNMRFASMPVVSPAQFLGAPGSEVCSQRICQALSELYEKWLADETRGPTAASALVRWIYVASRVTAETDEAIRARHGNWVTFEDPLDATTKSKGLPQTLREHLDDAIIAWFEATAWQYRPTESSMLTPEGDDWEPPSWYAEEDPLQSLPEADRLELLDWLNVMVGRPPVDPTPRYAGTSRADIGKVLASLCSYEQLATDKELKSDIGRATFRQYLSAADTEIRKQVDKLTGGRIKTYAYTESKSARRLEKVRSDVETSIAKRKAEAEGKAPEQLEEELKDIRASYDKRLAPHFMEVLADLLIGTETVKEDPVLSLYALCTAGVPLARGEASQLSRYKSLFRQAGGTIKHEPEFKREFAEETGQHSECVARRLARHVWEDGRLGAWYKRGNWTDPYLFAKTAYRVPCNAAQEKELRDMIGAGALPVREEWEKSERSIRASLEGEQPVSEIEEARREEEQRGLGQEDVARIEHRLARAAEKRARENISLSKSDQALRMFVPNPIDFLPVLYGLSK